MPTENQTRPCIHDGCSGTQIYRFYAAPVNWHTRLTARERENAWVCDNQPDHFDPVGLPQ